jgi:hypothetical protein
MTTISVFSASRSLRRGGDTAALLSPAFGLVNEPLCNALFRFIGVTELFKRNGLIAKRLESNTSENGPPASASARIFPEELFFGEAARCRCHRHRMPATTRQAGGQRSERYAPVSVPPYIGLYRLVPLRVRIFFRGRDQRDSRDSNDGKEGKLSLGIVQSDGLRRLPSASVASRGKSFFRARPQPFFRKRPGARVSRKFLTPKGQ